jgi:hypothetical protein
MMLGLVNDGKYWIDELRDKVISLLKDTLRGGYTLIPVAKEDTVVSTSITKHSERGNKSICLIIGWFHKHINNVPRHKRVSLHWTTHYDVYKTASVHDQELT